MTRDNLWQRLRALEGRTLRTVTGRGVFEVLRVADDAVHIRVRSSGREYGVRRREIEAGGALGLRGAALTPFRVRQASASEYRPAYVAALLRAVDGDARVLGQAADISGLPHA
jgi:hypothetical protein